MEFFLFKSKNKEAKFPSTAEGVCLLRAKFPAHFYYNNNIGGLRLFEVRGSGDLLHTTSGIFLQELVFFSSSDLCHHLNMTVNKVEGHHQEDSKMNRINCLINRELILSVSAQTDNIDASQFRWPPNIFVDQDMK